MIRKSGIYKLTNLINNKIYIGKSINLYKRLLEHKTGKKNHYIGFSIRKYGIENFNIEILAEYKTDSVTNDELLALETAFIEYFDCLSPNGYNICLFSNDRTGLKNSQEHRQRISKGNLGRIGTKYWLGKHIPEEQKIRTSNTLIKLYSDKKNHPRFGKNHSLNSKEKMANAKKGTISNSALNIKIINLITNEIKEFPSYQACANFLNLKNATFMAAVKGINSDKCIKKKGYKVYDRELRA